MDLNDLFNTSALRDLDLVPVLLNLALVLVMGQILGWHYVRFSTVLSNTRRQARVFVFIAATTMLVITIVKTSLALSLGLVGALSIIRFRTPVKEPEDLAYLFLAIGLGIGLGADQRVATLLMVAGILLYLAITSLLTSRSMPPRLYIHVSSELDQGAQPADGADKLIDQLMLEAKSGASRVDLRRVDVEERAFSATLLLDINDPNGVGALLSRLRAVVPNGSISMVDGSTLD